MEMEAQTVLPLVLVATFVMRFKCVCQFDSIRGQWSSFGIVDCNLHSARRVLESLFFIEYEITHKCPQHSILRRKYFNSYFSPNEIECGGKMSDLMWFPSCSMSTKRIAFRKSLQNEREQCLPCASWIDSKLGVLESPITVSYTLHHDIHASLHNHIIFLTVALYFATFST